MTLFDLLSVIDKGTTVVYVCDDGFIETGVGNDSPYPFPECIKIKQILPVDNRILIVSIYPDEQ